MSLRVAARLAADGIGCRVLDLRWIAPLPAEDILREANVTGRVLVADETRRTGGVSEAIITTLSDAGFTGKTVRVTSQDSFIPLGDAAQIVLLSEASIESAARSLVPRLSRLALSALLLPWGLRKYPRELSRAPERRKGN